VVAERSRPVPTLRAVTSARVTTAPVGSVTVPRMVPRKVCAAAGAAQAQATASAHKRVEAARGRRAPAG
jgi:hypothetical protein